jgi:hypothetical protein
MRIHLHVGPPKTGTSSLQKALLTRYGAPEPQPIWYPTPERTGDGHADLVHRAIGHLGVNPESTVFDDVAQRALDGGCHDLILSSEGCTAVALSDRWPVLASLARYGEVSPIVTFVPIGKRINSYWQELSKHLKGHTFENARQLIADNLIEIRLISALIEMFPDRTVSAIFLSNDDDTGALFRRFAAATGLGLSEDDTAGRGEVVNRSLGRMETDLMVALSQSWRQRTGKADEYWYARWHLFQLFKSPAWRAIPKAPIGFPQAWVEMLAGHAQTVVEALKALRESGTVAIFGDLERFDDVARSYKWPGIQIHRGAPMVAASVILQTSNHGEALRPAVESALKQTLQDLELIIVGDNCDPETRAAAQDLAASDPRVRFQDNQGNSDSAASLHNAVGEARGGFIAYLDGYGLWLPNHLQVLAKLLEYADFAHSLHAGLDKNGAIGFSACDLANADLRHRLVSSEQSRFDSLFVGHRVDAYRRLPGGWHATPVDAKWPGIAMWRQFLAEPWCRACSTPEVTGLSLGTYLRLYLPTDGRPDELKRWLANFEDPAWVADLHGRAVRFLNRQAVAVQIAQWEAEAQVRDRDAKVQEQEAKQREQEAELSAQRAQLQGVAAQLQDQHAAVAQISVQLAGAAQRIEALDQENRAREQEIAFLQRRLARARRRRAKLKKHWAWRFSRPFRRSIRWLVRGE